MIATCNIDFVNPFFLVFIEFGGGESEAECPFVQGPNYLTFRSFI